MLTMTQINYIRNLYFNEGKTKAEISRITKLDIKTVRKYIEKQDFNLEVSKPHNFGISILDPFKEIIDKWIEDDKIMRKKQRHTAKKVCGRLRNEYFYRTVADYFKTRKKDIWNQSTNAIPLQHKMGEMQVDFGAIQFWSKSELVNGFSLNVTFPFSNAGYLQIFRGENQQCLFEGLINIFKYINGIPKKIWFDNMSTAVKKVLKGEERELTDEFSRFKNHFNFDALFCNPASGNEKGSVENKVGYLR
ncbi:IS21 family transposase [Cetobacterium sp.]|uniref:IS21 family transposase n=1 Tax=Cetobacterium sp. TaxID=2071632 RepID=UPI003F3CE9D4